MDQFDLSNRPEISGVLKNYAADSGWSRTHCWKALVNIRLGYKKYPVSHDCEVTVRNLDDQYYKELVRKSNPNNPPDMEYKSIYGPGISDVVRCELRAEQLLDFLYPDE